MLCAFYLALWALVTVAALVMIRNGSLLAFRIALGVEVACSAGIGIYIGVRAVQQWHVPALPVRAARGWRYESSTPGSSPLYQHPDAVSRVLFSFGVLFAGFYLAMFITTLLPETLPEHRARLWMADRLRERGLLPSWPAAN